MSRSARTVKAQVASKRQWAAEEAVGGGHSGSGQTVEALKQQMARQQQERNELVDAINALQRNFEGLSNVMAKERQEHEHLKGKYKDLKRQAEDAQVVCPVSVDVLPSVG